MARIKSRVSVSKQVKPPNPEPQVRVNRNTRTATVVTEEAPQSTVGNEESKSPDIKKASVWTDLYKEFKTDKKNKVIRDARKYTIDDF